MKLTDTYPELARLARAHGFEPEPDDFGINRGALALAFGTFALVLAVLILLAAIGV